jgi:hypothetical protein
LCKRDNAKQILFAGGFDVSFVRFCHMGVIWFLLCLFVNCDFQFTGNIGFLDQTDPRTVYYYKWPLQNARECLTKLCYCVS